MPTKRRGPRSKAKRNRRIRRSRLTTNRRTRRPRKSGSRPRYSARPVYRRPTVRRLAPGRHLYQPRPHNENGQMFLSNLDIADGPVMSAEELLTCKFQTFGRVDSVKVHKNVEGQLIGTAEVVMHDKFHAMIAMEKMDGRDLFDDGRPIYIEKKSSILWKKVTGREEIFWKRVKKLVATATRQQLAEQEVEVIRVNMRN